MKKISILLVDDHALIRKGLRNLLESDPKLRVAGEAVDGEEAFSQALELKPDVVVMDITMPKSDGIQACKAILKELPDTRIIALSIHGGKRFIEKMLSAGASGYILKDSAPEELLQAIHTVTSGRQFLSAEVTGMVISQYISLLSKTQAAPHAGPITANEQELILLEG